MTDKTDPAKPAGAQSGTTPGTTPGAFGGSTPGPTQGSAGTTPGSGGMGNPTPSGSSDGDASTGPASLGETARRTASDAASAARDIAAEQTGRAREAVAEEVSGISHALRTAADDLREGSPQERTFAQIADTLADAAEAIRGKDLGEMMQEVTRMAQRHPMTFLGGAALLGFTAVRFARASRGDTDRPRTRRGAGFRIGENRPGPTTAPSAPASPEVASARRMP